MTTRLVLAVFVTLLFTIPGSGAQTEDPLEAQRRALAETVKQLEVAVITDVTSTLKDIKSTLQNMDSKLGEIKNDVKNDFERAVTPFKGLDVRKTAEKLETIDTNMKSALSTTFGVMLASVIIAVVALGVSWSSWRRPVEVGEDSRNRIEAGVQALRSIESVVQSALRPLTPAITGIYPNTGDRQNPPPVSIGGVNFRPEARVRFGEHEVPAVVRSPNLLTAQPPALPVAAPAQPGQVLPPIAVQVRVVNPGEQVSPSSVPFTYT